jgi:uncharacterized protein YerC
MIFKTLRKLENSEVFYKTVIYVAEIKTLNQALFVNHLVYKVSLFNKLFSNFFSATAILPEYIHYYGYYYQVMVQCYST